MSTPKRPQPNVDPEHPQPSVDKSLDLLGIKGVSDSVKILTQAAVNGAGEFLKRICLPAAKQYGLLMEDHVKEWRTLNATRAAIAAEELLKKHQGDKEVHAPPRIVSDIIEKVSWIDDQQIQDMWAGLLASSCTEDGKDDNNVVFVSILSQLSRSEAILVKWMVENSRVTLTDEYFHKIAVPFKVGEKSLLDLMGLPTPDLLQGQLQHLRSLGLIEKIDVDAWGSHEAHHCYISIQGTTLALRLYARCCGSNESIWQFYELHRFYPGSPDKPIDLLEILKAKP